MIYASKSLSCASCSESRSESNGKRWWWQDHKLREKAVRNLCKLSLSLNFFQLISIKFTHESRTRNCLWDIFTFAQSANRHWEKKYNQRNTTKKFVIDRKWKKFHSTVPSNLCVIKLHILIDSWFFVLGLQFIVCQFLFFWALELLIKSKYLHLARVERLNVLLVCDFQFYGNQSTPTTWILEYIQHWDARSFDKYCTHFNIDFWVSRYSVQMCCCWKSFNLFSGSWVSPTDNMVSPPSQFLCKKKSLMTGEVEASLCCQSHHFIVEWLSSRHRGSSLHHACISYIPRDMWVSNE